MVLDRVEAEWPIAARHLAEDNLDIEHTLHRIERTAPAGIAATAVSAGITQPSSGAFASDREHHLSTRFVPSPKARPALARRSARR